MRRYSGRQVAGLVIGFLGLQAMLSAAVINPWVGPIWWISDTDYLDVQTGYCGWAGAFGVLLVLLGRSLARSKQKWMPGFAALTVILSSVVLADRFVLAFLGLTMWTHDPVLHFRNRPNIVRSLSSYGRGGDMLRINRFGQLDDNFPVAKPAGELRGLMIGDSTTMGFGIPNEETIAAHLETMLSKTDTGHASHQVINAGVHGFAAAQELEMMRRCLRFDPDFITIGFTLNDVTEPFIVDRRLGGTGFDYHRVVQTANPVLGRLISDTGFGRILQRERARRTTYDLEKRREEHTVEEMVLSPPDHPKVREGWRMTLENLTAMYTLAKQHDILAVLIIFPYTFQLDRKDLQGPQQLLTEHAQVQGIDVLDLTLAMEHLVAQSMGLMTGEARRRDEKTMMNTILRRWYLDQNHLKNEGNEAAALTLLGYLVDRGLVTPPPSM